MIRTSIKHRSVNVLNSGTRDKQQGAAVLLMTIIMVSILTIIMVSILTIIGITMSKSSVMQTRMSINVVERQKALIAADSAVNYGWDQANINFNIKGYVENCTVTAAFDLRTNAATSCTATTEGEPAPTAKNLSVWQNFKSATDWSWEDTSQHENISNIFAMTANFLTSEEQTNPMHLSSAPQYAIGIHDPILRRGTDDYYCIPISVIGAGKGSVDTAKALIEINAIPKNSCFRKMIH